MTRTNTTLIAAVAAVALALDTRSDLDELPQLCGLTVSNDGGGLRVRLQSGADLDATAAQEVSALLAWRTALGESAHITATVVNSPDRWAVCAVGQIAGVQVEVWDHITVNDDLAGALSHAQGPVGAGAVLVQALIGDLAVREIQMYRVPAVAELLDVSPSTVRVHGSALAAWLNVAGPAAGSGPAAS